MNLLSKIFGSNQQDSPQGDFASTVSQERYHSISPVQAEAVIFLLGGVDLIHEFFLKGEYETAIQAISIINHVLDSKYGKTLDRLNDNFPELGLTSVFASKSALLKLGKALSTWGDVKLGHEFQGNFESDLGSGKFELKINGTFYPFFKGEILNHQYYRMLRKHLH